MPNLNKKHFCKNDSSFDVQPVESGSGFITGRCALDEDSPFYIMGKSKPNKPVPSPIPVVKTSTEADQIPLTTLII